MAAADETGAGSDPGPRVLALRRAVVEALAQMGEASQRLRMLFDELDVAMSRAAAMLDDGTTAQEMARAVNLPGRREGLNGAAQGARDAQHLLLRSLFRLAEAEGASKSETARTWRVSRQLVSRMVHELDEPITNHEGGI